MTRWRRCCAAALLGMLAAPVPGAARPVLAPPLCPATPASLPFAPPVDRPMRLDVTTTRPASSGPAAAFSMTYRLRFHAEGRGFGLTAVLTRLGTGQATGMHYGLFAILEPLVGRPLEFLVGANGQTLMLQDGERLWQSISDDLLAAAAKSPEREPQRIAALITALPLAEREAMLAGDIRQMLRFAGRNWATDFAAAPETDNRDCALLMLVEREPAARPDTPFVHQRRWQVDARTGLVSVQSDEQWLRGSGDKTPERAVRTERVLTIEE